MSEPLVLHVRLVTGTGGGPDKTVLNSPRHLRRLGYDCICAYLHPPGDPGFSVLEERAKKWEAPLVSIPDRGPWDLKVLYDLARICRERRVAIWHAHEYKSNVFGLLVRRLWRMKLVTTVHGWGVHEGRAPLYNRIDRRVLKYYDHVVSVSADLHDECRRFGVRPERSSIIHNAIDTDQFRRTMTTAAAKQQLQAPSDGVLLGAMGRLSEEKRFDLLIDAVAQLRSQGLDVHLWIAGEGPEREKLTAKIAAHSLGDTVRLLGMVTDPRVWLQAIDLFVLSSEREGLPNVVLEAMAMETPVVATRIAGVPGLLNDGDLGVLVAPGSSAALADGIQCQWADSVARENMVAAALQKVHETHSFEHRMNRMASLYGRLLGRTDAARHEPVLQSV